jgi:hypothetical protein
MMPTQKQQPKGGVNPGNPGPAQPKDVQDPHPDDEEGYTHERRPGAERDAAKGGKRPSDTAKRAK